MANGKFRSSASAAAACLIALAGSAAAAPPRVPEGFVVEVVAGPPDVTFPMFAAFDDQGRLFVTESSGGDLYDELRSLTRKCRVRMLEDRDGDGRFETSSVFADKLVFPMGLAWRDGRLYVADPPDLVALEDTDGDGRADRRTVILTGFGHTDNGSLHGLTFGPDGLLYMTTGNPDGYELKRPDGASLRGKSGALLRCGPDGSGPEVLCRGFENLVEVVFTPRGEILGTDNWYQRPTGGIRDALVHLVDGGLYPRYADEGTPQPITGDFLPPASLFPPVALSGLALYRGAAFPEPMRGNLFSAQHNARKVGRHELVPEGATFRTRDFDFVTSDDPDFHPSDVLEAADGSLLVVDTGGWYVQHCPTGKIRRSMAKGGITRVRWARAAAAADDPWGLHVDWQRAALPRLAGLLGDPRPCVRDRAQRTLSARGAAAVEVLSSVLSGPAGATAKGHALWALAAIPGDAALAPLRRMTAAADADLVATAARALAARGDRAAAPDLCRLLGAADPRLRMAAAEALARCGGRDGLPALWRALADRPDRFLEHALIHAAHRTAGAPDLEAALDHPNPGIQKAALLLLDQPPRKGLAPEPVIARVAAADAELRRTALRILRGHPEWAPHAMGIVREWLAKPAPREEERSALRDLIPAFESEPALQDLVGEALAAPPGGARDACRELVLAAMARTGLRAPPASWVTGLARSLAHPSAAVRAQAARTAGALRPAALDEPLAKLAEDAGEPPEVRLEALRAMAARRPELSPGAFDWLLGRVRDAADPVGRLAAAELLGRSRLSDAQIAALARAVRGDALVAPAVLLPALRRASDAEAAGAVVAYLEEAIRRGWPPTEAELAEVLRGLPEAARVRAGGVMDLLRRSADRTRERLAEFEPLLAGGDAGRGRALFFGKAVCATCHRIGPEGGEIGPDLTKVGAVRSGRDLLESVLVPSSTFAQGYENYAVTLKDGRVAGGILARQGGGAIVLRDSSGAELTIRKDEMEEMKRQSTSIMPEGLERLMTPEEFRDLLAFLQGLR